MALLAGFLGAILGALTGGITTYLTTRSSLRIELEHSYDQSLQGKRLECYQELFHISECLPRYWPPTATEPARSDLQGFLDDFHGWYFGKDAGGMFLTPTAKDIYLSLMNLLAEAAFSGGTEPASPDARLSAPESQGLRQLASELRHQLAEDVGAANPPRLRWARPRSQAQPPGISR